MAAEPETAADQNDCRHQVPGCVRYLDVYGTWMFTVPRCRSTVPGCVRYLDVAVRYLDVAVRYLDVAVRYLDVAGPQGLDELVQLAAEVVDGRLAPGSGWALLALAQTLLQLGEGLQVGVHRHGHAAVGDLGGEDSNGQ